MLDHAIAKRSRVNALARALKTPARPLNVTYHSLFSMGQTDSNDSNLGVLLHYIVERQRAGKLLRVVGRLVTQLHGCKDVLECSHLQHLLLTHVLFGLPIIHCFAEGQVHVQALQHAV